MKIARNNKRQCKTRKRRKPNSLGFSCQCPGIFLHKLKTQRAQSQKIPLLWKTCTRQKKRGREKTRKAKIKKHNRFLLLCSCVCCNHGSSLCSILISPCCFALEFRHRSTGLISISSVCCNHDSFRGPRKL